MTLGARSAARSLVALAILATGCAASPRPSPVTALPPLASAPPPARRGPDVSEEIARAEAALLEDDAIGTRLAAEEALAKDPSSVKALYYAGVALEKLGQLREAEGRYKRALAVDPTFPEAAINLGAMYIDADRGVEALELLRPVARAWPADPMLQENLGLAAHLVGEHETVVLSFARLDKQGLLRDETRLAYVDALLATKRRDQAEKVLTAALSAPPRDQALLAPFANQLAGVGMFEPAIRLVGEALAKKPSAELFTRRALYRRATKDDAGARADLEKALQLDDNLAAAHLYLGELLEAARQPAKARKELERALALTTDETMAKRARDGLARMVAPQ